MKEKYDVIVVGGGYFGCSCAYHLAKAGVRTLLLEEKEISSGASGANFGNVQVQDSELGISLEMSIDGSRRMAAMEDELGCDLQYGVQPNLIGAETEEHFAALRELYQGKKDSGLNIEWLEEEQIRQIEPNMRKGRVLAATNYMQGRVYPFLYLYGLIRKGKNYGLTVKEHTPVSRLWSQAGRCIGVVLSDDSVIHAENVVIAAGSKTRELCLTSGLSVPVYSVKAEAIITEQIQPYIMSYYSSAGFFAEAHGQDNASTSLCFFQSNHGNIIVGETTKPHKLVAAEAQDLTSMEHTSVIHEQLLDFYPGLKKINLLRSMVTASPFTENNLPCLGKSRLPGLLLCAGFKSAVVMSPVAGQLISDLVTKDSTAYDIEDFSVNSGILLGE